MTVGKITALLSYQGMLVSPMIFFSELNNSYNSTLIAIDRLKEILDFKDELQEGIDLHFIRGNQSHLLALVEVENLLW